MNQPLKPVAIADFFNGIVGERILIGTGEGPVAYDGMPQFITIGYGDKAGYDLTEKSVRDAAHAADAERVRRGDQVGIAGKPVQVRNHDGTKVEITEGAFLSAGLPIAGFALIEASDLSAAIEIAANSPCAVAQGVVEVWPLNPTSDAKT